MQKTRNLIRVLVVDDHSVVREGLRALLSAVGDFEVVAEAADGLEAIAAVTRWKPDVTLMDLLMPKLDGVQATRRILKAFPEAKVLVLTTIPNWYRVHLCLEAGDRKSTRLNSSHSQISYAVFCLKKKKK